MESSYETVAIVGVGLIGGSIGLALQQRKLASNAIGVGRRETSLRRAESAGVITEWTTDLARGVSRAELIIVCTPVATIVDTVLQVSRSCPADAVITDAGSTKQIIVSELEKETLQNGSFVGSHPLAGGHGRGPDAARADLFENRTVVLTPTEHSNLSSVKVARHFWEQLGANVSEMSTTDHDAALAATSHLPHLIASTLAAATPPEWLGWAAGGWADTTRIAAGDENLWEQIFAHNRVELLEALDRFTRVLDSFRDALEKDDALAVSRWLKKGKQHRDALGD